MNQEEIDFQIFKENNLESVDFNTGFVAVGLDIISLTFF